MLLTVCDESISGEKTNRKTITLAIALCTAADILRERVRQEVELFNNQQESEFQGLVQPEDSLRSPRGYKLKTKRIINWEEQYEKAIAAFNKNAFLMLVNNKQIVSLDEELEISEDMEISFMRLTPLVGG
ncbi:hypothetical protein Syn7502_02218 [Synechococcus sp. PCC 7502]|uniref:hypothetical protein n=1 Tax=Synechococcus sp. PCC 7502 TaxID=1173263 RepID=UPI00029FA40A|nr:hypothetical protein [Synechococcus sp. PCC 7502]AFY74226.1 hypothetical protein Syn7502_02218 [Synechococcus sp. PCC 7502]